MYDFQGNKTSAVVNDFYETVFDIVFRCLILGKSRSCFSPGDGIVECCINASDKYGVQLTLYWDFERHTILSNNAIRFFGNEITKGFNRHHNTIVLYSFDGDGFGGFRCGYDVGDGRTVAEIPSCGHILSIGNAKKLA